MKKFLTICTTVIIAGVILYGSGSVIAFNTTNIQTAKEYGIIQIGMENNASFLAPVPITFNVDPVFLKSPYEQAVLNCELTTSCMMAKN